MLIYLPFGELAKKRFQIAVKSTKIEIKPKENFRETNQLVPNYWSEEIASVTRIPAEGVV